MIRGFKEYFRIESRCDIGLYMLYSINRFLSIYIYFIILYIITSTRLYSYI